MWQLEKETASSREIVLEDAAIVQTRDNEGLN